MQAAYPFRDLLRASSETGVPENRSVSVDAVSMSPYNTTIRIHIPHIPVKSAHIKRDTALCAAAHLGRQAARELEGVRANGDRNQHFAGMSRSLLRCFLLKVDTDRLREA